MLDWKSVNFDNKNSMTEYGYMLESWEIGTPEPNITLVQIAGRDDPLDMSETVGGRVTYGTRILTFNLGTVGDLADRTARLQRLMNELHGKRKKIHCSWLDGYYSGRISVSAVEEEEPFHSAVKVECVCNPYRYHDEPTVVTQAISGSETITLTNSAMAVTPTIVTDSAMDITWNGRTWSVVAGTHYLPIVLESGDTDITFTGSGNVTITYTEGDL